MNSTNTNSANTNSANTNSANRKTCFRIQAVRVATQAVCLLVTVFGSFALVRSMGLPNWAFLASIVLFGVFFCGWVCPFGSAQEWLRFLGKKLTSFTLTPSPRLDRYLVFSRYAVLALGAVWFWSALDARKSFMFALAGRSAGAAAVVVLAVLLLLGLVMDRPYCKYLCRFGATAGLLSMLRVVAVRRDAGKCRDCGRCNKACQMGVDIASSHTVRDPNCINCGVCLGACPVEGALTAGPAVLSGKDLRALKEKYRRRPRCLLG